MESPSKHQVNKQKGKPHTAIYIQPDFKKTGAVIRDTQCSTKKIKVHMQRQK
jgi:hypothetical protein